MGLYTRRRFGAIGFRRKHICGVDILDVPHIDALPRHVAGIEAQGGFSYPRPYIYICGYCRLVYTRGTRYNRRVAGLCDIYYSVGGGTFWRFLQITEPKINSRNKSYNIFVDGLDRGVLLSAISAPRILAIYHSNRRRWPVLHYRCCVLCHERV